MSLSFGELFRSFIKIENDTNTKFSEYKYRQLLNESVEEKPLEEGRGMVARKEGEEFVNKTTGDKKYFSQVLLFPTNGGAFKTLDELFKSIRKGLKLQPIAEPLELTEKIPNLTLEKIVNSPSSLSRAAMLTVLQDEKGKKFGFLKYFNSLTSGGIGKWTEANFAQDTGYAKQKGTSALEKMPLQPSLIVGDYKARTVSELRSHILQNVKKYIDNGELPPVVIEHIDLLFKSALAKKGSPVLEGALPYQTAYDKYLGELFAPVAVIQKWLVTGQSEESEKVLVKGKGGSYAKMKIRFPQAIQNALVDSEMIYGKETAPSITVGVSSKAGSGAAASTSSLYKTLKEGNYPPVFKKKYAAVITLIEKVVSSSSVMGPLEIAINWGLISQAEAKYVFDLFSGTISNITLPQYIIAIKKGTIKKPSNNLLKLSSLLGGLSPLEMVKKKDLISGYRPGYHYLAGIAKQIALIAQNNNLFSDGIKEILSRSSMVQVYSHTKKAGQNGIQFQEFNVKYPPTFKGRIIVDASKNYFASAPPKGKLGFKLVS